MAFEINPSISTILENAQRANPEYGKKSKDVKGHKLKTRKSRQLSADTTSLSEEMMGDMDPDEYHSRDNSDEFKQRLKEMQEESKKTRETDPEELQDEEAEERRRVESPDWDEEDPDDGDKKNGEAVSLDEETGGESDFEQDHSVCEEDDEADQEPDLPGETGEEAEENRKPIHEKEPVWTGLDSPRRSPEYGDSKGEMERGDDGDTGFVPLVEESAPEASQVRSSSEFISLLSYDEGYIIADPGKKPVHTNESNQEPLENGSENNSRKILPPSLKARFTAAMNELVFCENRGAAYDRLGEYLKCFGVRVMETCRDNGERILLLRENKNIGDYTEFFPNQYDESIRRLRWGYFPREKMVILGEEVFSQRESKVCIPVLYIGFAFDHALGSEGFASERSPAVLSNYSSCKNRQPGHQFLDSFASRSPIHYFAQCVEAFLRSPRGSFGFAAGGAVKGAKELLYDNDRSMYSYIEYLLGQINRSAEMNEDEPADIGGVV